MRSSSTLTMPGMSLRPGHIQEALVPPSLLGNNKRGRRPVIVVGHDPSLGVLVIPVTSVVNGDGLPVDNGDLHGQACISALRWMQVSAFVGRVYDPLPAGEFKRILEAARPHLVKIGQRELYRAAKRSL